MFFPLGTDRRLQRVPWVNYALIAVNVLLYIFLAPYIQHVTYLSLVAAQAQLDADPGTAAAALEQLHQQFVFHLYLRPDRPALHQFLTYPFLHQDFWHLLGNMIFLYVFGNAVEDRLGKVGYLAFYLAGGVVAGTAHLLFADAPVLGASGAVAAVTGIYLALFPLSIVTIGYFLIIIGTFEVSSIVLILFRVAQDLLFQLLGIGNVAYVAHLAGYGLGFAVGMGLLLTRILPREPVDLLAVIDHRRRKRAFRRLSARAPVWDHASAPGDPPKEGDAPTLSPEQEALMQRRAAITTAAREHDLPAAANAYAALLADHPRQVMPQSLQLDLANTFMEQQRYGEAAAAYDLLLQAYPQYPQRAQVELILGLIYARHLDEPARARPLLTAAAEQLDADDAKLARTVVNELS